MISIARVVLGAAALVWLTPAASPPVASQPTPEPVEEIHEESYDGCTFRFINRYNPDDSTQYARTRQVRSEDCRFGSRNRTIRVKVCFEGPADDPPVDCSAWLRPTADAAYAESEIEGATPKGSVHYVEIRDAAWSFAVSAPELPTVASPTPTAQPTVASPTPTVQPPGSPSPANTSLAAGSGFGRAGAEQPERPVAAPGPDTDHRLAATLAVSGMALLGLGGAGVWVLRRSASGVG